VRILGIDPGVHGGLAVIEITNGAALTLVTAIDVPVIGIGAKQTVDVIALQEFLLHFGPTHCYFERAQAMPRQGASSGFLYGRAVGALEAVVSCCAIPLTRVEPTRWKRAFHLAAKDKEGARQRALQLFPAAHEMLRRKADHGRAEAALIALAGANHA
jgi:crossover junction endodeoxyribonuclease RuvC